MKISYEDIWNAGLVETPQYRDWLDDRFGKSWNEMCRFFLNEEKFDWPEFERWRDWHAQKRNVVAGP